MLLVSVYTNFSIAETIDQCQQPTTSMSLVSHLTGIVTRARRPSGINPTNRRELLHPSFIDRWYTRDRESKT